MCRHPEFTVVQNIFGSSYIPESHGDEMLNYLSSPTAHPIGNPGEGFKFLTSAISHEVMKSLHSALAPQR